MVQVSDGTNTAISHVAILLNNLNDNPPVVTDASFTVDENAATGTVVGTVTARDADGDPLTFRVFSGNDTGAFAVDAATGKITVADSSQLDYETNPSVSLTVQVGDGTHTANATIAINLNNLNDNPPVVKDVEFSVDENAATGTVVGKVEASDADGDTLNYRIIGGNQTGTFTIDPATGEIKVADSSKLDYETIKSFALEVQVSDGTHLAGNTVTVSLNNLNDNAPVGKDGEFSVDENAGNGANIGTMEASDADGDALSYRITDGNEAGALSMDATTGEITIADASLLDAATKALHTLSVHASDGQHTAALTVTVHVLSSDATLSQLTTNHSGIKPEFKPGTTQYFLSVGGSIHTIKLTPTTADANATLKINGKPAASGQESEAISLDMGKNIITIEVTAQNGQTAMYTLIVTRLQKVVTAVPVNEGGTVTVSDEEVNLLDDNGTLVVELKKGLDKVKTIKFTAQQLETLIQRHALIKIVKEDVQLLIPAANFAKGVDLVISLERIEKNPKKLPSSDLAVGAVYDFTIKQGDQVISHFDQDIELAFSAAGYVHPEELKVYYWNEVKKKWELVGGTFKDGQIKATTNHFSTFAVFQPKDLVVEKPSSGSDSPGKKPSSESELPKTATDMYNWLLAGILVLILGGALFLVQRLREKEGNI